MSISGVVEQPHVTVPDKDELAGLTGIEVIEGPLICRYKVAYDKWARLSDSDGISLLRSIDSNHESDTD